MNLLRDPLQASMALEPGLGLSMIVLLLSLGAAGTAIVVTRRFLGCLKNMGDEQSKIIEQFKGYHAVSQQQFQDHLDVISDHHEEYQHEFQSQINLFSETQNVILRDMIVTMHNLEKTVDNSSATIDGVQTTIGTLGQTVRSIDFRLGDAADKVRQAEPLPPTVERKP
jgi:methyl-accepting chemotaxis protein